MTSTKTKPGVAPPRVRWWLGATLLAAIAVFFLWEEHSAHLLGALPWLLLLACPLIHLFMHGGHGHGHGRGPSEGPSDNGHSHHGGAP